MTERLSRNLANLASVAIGVAGTALALFYVFGLSSLPISANFQDWLTLLDGAARQEAGQRAHVDFQTLIGPMSYWLTSVSLRLNPGAGAFLTLHALALLMALPAVLLILRHSEGWARPMVLLLFLVTMLAPFNLDAGPACVLNYNGTYNRWGSGLLLAMAVALCSARDWERSDVLLASLVLLLAFSLKTTIGGSAVLMVGLAVLGRRLAPKPVLTVAGLFAIGFLALDLMTGVVRSHLADLLGVWRLSGETQRSLVLIGLARYGVELTLALLGLAALGRYQRVGLPGFAWQAGLIGAIFLSDAFTYGGLPMIPVLGIFLARRGAVYAAPTPAMVGMLAAMAAVLLLPLAKILMFNPACLAKNAFSATDLRPLDLPGRALAGFRAHRIYLEAQPSAEEMRVRGSTLGDEAFHRDPAAQVFALRAAAEAAAVLVQRYPVAPGHRTLDFADPFAVMLNWVPPTGAPVTLHVGRTLGPGHFPPAERFFAGVRVVLVPTCSLFQENRTLIALYRDTLARDFTREPLTSCWDIHTRKG